MPWEDLNNFLNLHLQEPSLLPAQFPDWSSSIMLKNDQRQGKKSAYKIC